MAKYMVTMACGHTEEVNLYGENLERQRKIEYYSENRLCTECYKKMLQEKENSEPFTFMASVLPYINEENGNVMLYIWFEGDVKRHEREIQKLGYLFERRNIPSDRLTPEKAPFCWGKTIDIEDFQLELIKAEGIGADVEFSPERIASALSYNNALQLSREWKQQHPKSLSYPVGEDERFDKDDFLKTEFGSALDEVIRCWDDALENRSKCTPENEKDGFGYQYWNHICEDCQARWEVFQLALRQFLHLDYHFSRTNECCGIVSDKDFTDWLIRIDAREGDYEKNN